MKQIFKLSLLFLALLLSADAIAYNFEIDGIYYDIYGEEVTVTGKEYDSYYGGYISDYTGSVSIPANVIWNGHNYSVTKIGDCAFSYCNALTSIYIPNSVTSIGSAAFYGCKGLTNINIPNSVATIGNNAFYGCTGLTSVNIPNSVTHVGGNAFSGTAWYNNQPNGVIYTGLVAYKYKGTMPEGTSIAIKEGTTEIAYSAFSGCSGLIDITIPNTVVSIGDCAFINCNRLTDISIPNSVVSIGDRAFYGTSWFDNQPGGLIYTGLVAYKYKGTMPEGTSISLNDGTLGISGRAFSQCNGLTNIIIPGTVTNIGSEAFYNCTSLTNINIPNSVTSIGEMAFGNCTGLTSIDIPNSLTTIARSTFIECI